MAQSGDPPKPRATGNIESRDNHHAWDPAGMPEPLARLFDYVIGEANRTERWYWSAKGPKAIGARCIQWSALLLAGLAGLLPVAAKMFPAVATWATTNGGAIDTGLLTTFCLGVAAALVGFDRAAGLSSGWTRYVLTATAVRTATEEFRMDWVMLSSAMENPPKDEHVSAMLQRAKAFRLSIEGLVTKETQEWATEFKNSLAQLEKDLAARFETARAERQKAEDEQKAQLDRGAAERRKAAEPGSLEATVVNARTADGFSFKAKLATNDAVFVEENVSNSESWAQLAVPAGNYKLIVTATVKNKVVSGERIVSVKPGETTTAQITLPAAP